MIHISITTAALVYTIALAGVFLVLYVYTEVGMRRTERILTRQFLWRCGFCGYTYLDEGAEALSECPRCHSINDEADGRPREMRTHTDRRSTGDEARAALLDEEPRRNPSRRKRPHQRRRGPRKR